MFCVFGTINNFKLKARIGKGPIIYLICHGNSLKHKYVNLNRLVFNKLKQ